MVDRIKCLLKIYQYHTSKETIIKALQNFVIQVWKTQISRMFCSKTGFYEVWIGFIYIDKIFIIRKFNLFQGFLICYSGVILKWAETDFFMVRCLSFKSFSSAKYKLMIRNPNVNYPFLRNSIWRACKNMINYCRTTTSYAGWTGNKLF